MRHLIIIGLMGTGKSSVGKELAGKLDLQWSDTDHEFEKTHRTTIRDYFRQYGEASFRIQETEILRAQLRKSSSILTTGGGIVLKQENRKLMQAYGKVISLTADPEVIIRRLSHDQTRPLLAGDFAQNIRRIYSERSGLYDFANLTIDTSSLSVNEVVNHICDFWQA